MSRYSFRDIERLLGLARPVVQGFVDAGFVAPERGERNELTFSFQDLALLKTAQGLAAARIPARKVRQALTRLRAELPPALPLSGIRIAAVDGQIVVQQGSSRWRPDSGQYLLSFDAEPESSEVQALQALQARPAPPADNAEEWIERAGELEAFDPDAAEGAYRHAIDRSPSLIAGYVNLGCLLQSRKLPEAAEQVYREAIDHAPGEPVLHFNLGTALEDLGRADDAIAAYEQAVALDPEFADAHYNLARLHEAGRHPQQAIRHLAQYRRLVATP